MKQLFIAYSATLVSMLVIDSVWLTVMADVLYRPVMGDMLLERFRAAPALAFYVIYAGGLVYFAVNPAIHSAKWTTAAVQGAALGLVAYATYDLTNQATLKNWSTALTLADICWGMIVSAAASTAGWLIVARLRT